MNKSFIARLNANCGLFTNKDLKVLEERYNADRARAPKTAKASTRPRETVYNTTRFKQKPGTSNIYGGRDTGKTNE